MSNSKRARLLPDLLTARKVRPAGRVDASAVTKAETVALSKARLRTKLVADLVQGRSGTLGHEAPVCANDKAAQTTPEVLYRKGDASATGFRPASWYYEPPPSADGDKAVVDPSDTSDNRDQELLSGGPTSPFGQSNLSASVSSLETGVEKESAQAAEASPSEADLRVAHVAESEAAKQPPNSGKVFDPLREESSHQASRAVHELLDQPADARLLDRLSNTVSPATVSEVSTDPQTDETILSSAVSHREPDHTAVASALQSDAKKTLQISASEGIAIAEVDPIQTRTVAPVRDQAAIARLLDPNTRNPAIPSQQQLHCELAVPPPLSAALGHEAANSSHVTVEIALPEREVLNGPIDLTPHAAELESPYAQSIKSITPTASEDRADITDTSDKTAEPPEESTGKEGAYAELGSVIENVLTHRQYGVAREARNDRISRGSLDAVSSDSLLGELEAARRIEPALPEGGVPFPFLGAGVVAAIVALIGCAVWQGQFKVILERLLELLS